MIEPKKSKVAFDIAPGVSNQYYINLALTTTSPKAVWKDAIWIFDQRIGRFTNPIKTLMRSRKLETIIFSGFAIMAIDCLLIETLESFRKGRPNPIGRPNPKTQETSTKTITDFLTQRDSFKRHFGGTKDKLFIDHFRNGILHQGEVKGSGLIRIDTPEMVLMTSDNQSLIINRLYFHQAILQEVKIYKRELISGKDIGLRKNFIKKMDEICRVDSSATSKTN